MSETVQTHANPTMPRVSCVCPTMPSRKEWLAKAIECFKAQTYSGNKELLVIADGYTPGDASGSDGTIPMITVGVPAGLSVGRKRNLGAELAEADIIIHWDDDDFSHPTRIADQVERLLDTGKAVTGYHSMRFTDGAKWWQYRGHPAAWAFDTSLCYRKSFWQTHRFEEINDGLEASFRNAAIRERQFISADGSDQMYVTIHEANTGARVMTPGSKTWEELPFACGGSVDSFRPYLVGE